MWRAANAYPIFTFEILGDSKNCFGEFSFKCQIFRAKTFRHWSRSFADGDVGGWFFCKKNSRGPFDPKIHDNLAVGTVQYRTLQFGDFKGMVEKLYSHKDFIEGMQRNPFTIDLRLANGIAFADETLGTDSPPFFSLAPNWGFFNFRIALSFVPASGSSSDRHKGVWGVILQASKEIQTNGSKHLTFQTYGVQFGSGLDLILVGFWVLVFRWSNSRSWSYCVLGIAFLLALLAYLWIARQSLQFGSVDHGLFCISGFGEIWDAPWGLSIDFFFLVLVVFLS